MKLEDTRKDFLDRTISKAEFIQSMYSEHHSKLFEYSNYLKQTNISSIEIVDGEVLITFRGTGLKMIFPEGDFRAAPVEALNFQDYEPTESSMVLKLVSPDDCVFDVGANVGWYSLNIAKKFPSSRVHAFEPIPKTHSLLVQNINRNKLTNISTHSFGLSNSRTDLSFYYLSEGSVNASSANLSERLDAEIISCHVERLDDFAQANDLHVDFIKCDVEGAELLVFQGAVQTLQKDVPIIYTEMLRKWAAKFNYHPNDIIGLLRSFGYRCFYAEGLGLLELHQMDDTTIETNFFFLHSQLHASKIHELLRS